MAQYDVLTGLSPRRRVRYADQIRAEAPAARRKYFADRDYRLRQDALDQSQRQFDAEQALLSEEFARQSELQRQQAEAAERQANVSNAISGLGLAKSAYPYAKKGVSAISNLISPSDASPVASNTGYGVAPDAYSSSLGVGEAVSPDVALAEGASPYAAYGYTEPAIQYGTSPALEALFADSAAAGAGDAALNLYGAGEAAIPGLAAGETAGSTAAGEAGAAAGGGLSWWGGPVIAAATIGQMSAAENSKPVEGVAPGHFFSQNESGNWRPRFAEPDKNLVSQMWGGGSTTGAKFDARLQKGDWQGGLKALPGFAHGYAIPGLDVAGNVGRGYVQRQTGSERFGNVVGSLIDPIGQASSGLANAKDIGDVAATVATGGIIDESHLCTMIHQEIGLKRKEILMMRIFKNWVQTHYAEDHDKYVKTFGKIAAKIRETAHGEKEVFHDLKRRVVDAVIGYMDKDDIKGAYLAYKKVCLELLKRLSPEDYPGYARAKMTEVENA